MQAAEIANLVGTRVRIDGTRYEVRGVVPNIPPRAVYAGEVVELLVLPETVNPGSEDPLRPSPYLTGHIEAVVRAARAELS
jgi:hypothetical protein